MIEKQRFTFWDIIVYKFGDTQYTWVVCKCWHSEKRGHYYDVYCRIDSSIIEMNEWIIQKLIVHKYLCDDDSEYYN